MLTDIEYTKIARFVEKLKIIHGPEFVNDTLRRHKDIYNALLTYEKRFIVDLESNLIHRSSDNE